MFSISFTKVTNTKVGNSVRFISRWSLRSKEETSVMSTLYVLDDVQSVKLLPWVPSVAISCRYWLNGISMNISNCTCCWSSWFSSRSLTISSLTFEVYIWAPSQSNWCAMALNWQYYHIDNQKSLEWLIVILSRYWFQWFFIFFIHSFILPFMVFS